MGSDTIAEATVGVRPEEPDQQKSNSAQSRTNTRSQSTETFELPGFSRQQSHRVYMARLLDIDVKSLANRLVRSRKQADALVPTIMQALHIFSNHLKTLL